MPIKKRTALRSKNKKPVIASPFETTNNSIKKIERFSDEYYENENKTTDGIVTNFTYYYLYFFCIYIQNLLQK